MATGAAARKIRGGGDRYGFMFVVLRQERVWRVVVGGGGW